MSLPLAALVRQEREAGLRRLAGTRITGLIPIRNALVEWVLATRRMPGALEGLRVGLHAGNHLAVVADIRVFGFRKRLETMLRLAPAIDTGPPRQLHLFFVDRSLLSSAMSFAGPFLPEWVRRHDHGFVLDLDRLAASAGLEDLLPHVATVAFEGDEGVLWVNFELQVAAPDVQAPTVSSPRTGPGQVGGGARLPLADLATLMAGARLAMRLRAEESLVNDVLEGLAAASEAPPGEVVGRAVPPDWRTIVELTSPPRLTFEPGAVVLDATLRSPNQGPQRD